MEHATRLDKAAGAALIVEDDPHMRTLLEKMVREFGYERVIGAGSSLEALDYLEFDRIAVAFVDLCLGAEDGGALIWVIRGHKRKPIRSVPILVVSKIATETRIRDAMKAGADGFIAKPFSMASFHRQVSMALMKRNTPLAPEANRLGAGVPPDVSPEIAEVD